MTREDAWRKAFYLLLDFFDSMEGTTYLYGAEEQKEFLRAFDPEIQNEIMEILIAYHSKRS